jgi:hypothetical protein
MSLTLYERLLPEYKIKISIHCVDAPYLYEHMISNLKSECFFTNVKYGVATDICAACEVKLFTDLFISPE